MAMVSFGIFVAQPILAVRLYFAKTANRAKASECRLESHDVLAAIDVNLFAGDSRARLRQQECRGSAHFARIDVALQRRALRMCLEHVAEIGDAARGISNLGDML